LFGELSITLLLFIHRLHRRLRAVNANEVLFLAREGLFLKELFDTYQSIVIPRTEHIPSRYLLVSRRALHSPSLPADEMSFKAIRDQYPAISVGGFLRSLGMVDNSEVHPDHHLAVGENAIDELICSPEFRTQFINYRDAQNSLLRRYLAPAVHNSGGHLHIVDVGWKGSMQDSLERFLGPDCKISGWYIGLRVNSDDAPTKHGLVFDIGPPESLHFNVFAHFQVLYELLLNANHPSVARYAADGTAVTPVLDQRAGELAQHHHLVAPVQEGIKEVFAALCEVIENDFGDSRRSERWVAYRHARMMFRPRTPEVVLARQLVRYDNFGEFRARGFDPSTNPNTHSIRSLARLARRPRTMFHGTWPPLELDRQGLGWLIRPTGIARSASAFWT